MTNEVIKKEWYHFLPAGILGVAVVICAILLFAPPRKTEQEPQLVAPPDVVAEPIPTQIAPIHELTLKATDSGNPPDRFQPNPPYNKYGR